MNMRIEKCAQCRNDVKCAPSRQRERYFCTRDCYSKWQSENQRGENNSNFGTRWTEEQRRKSGEKIAAAMTDERRIEIGNQHRGKVESEETRRKKSEAHKNQGVGIKPYEMTDEIRVNIGRASSAKFTPEYKARLRAIGEANGTIIPLSQKDDYAFYRELANWSERMFDRVTDKIQLEKLQELGVFNNRTNAKGVVRDHIFSRRSGLTHGVFPELLRHPSNLQVLTHGENVGKGHRREKDDQTLEQLFSRIRQFQNAWHEQEFCLKLIERYENGERYDKTEYVKCFYENT